ncbi:hypothetical protein BDY21DRAFT_378319 [Lineolata rhizophorae]|uniref:Plus3 domain-containing protein n=1 Tax=Lineolata rhizophorae TaxID=578093 RepID=A0A6A6P3E7_9PEZI|nr:hypothetical protein BDY21DRAFT_378319 [Lineolata rhizophorae]
MSDSEFDEELLALAGEDEPGEEASPAPSQGRSPSPASSSASPKPLDTATSPPSARKLATTRSKSESEEGEASSPESLGSGAMSESESDSAPAPADSDDEIPDGGLYPVEGRFTSDKDRAEIMALPEIRREEILAERAAEVERKNQDLHLRRLLQAREKEEQRSLDKKKRKAGAADLDDSARKSTRAKTSKASDTLEAYKRQRERRGLERRGEATTDRLGREERGRRSSTRSRDDSDADAAGDSDVEWDPAAAATAKASKRDPSPDLRDFHRCHITRDGASRFGLWPEFEEVVQGCYVRICIGLDPQTKQQAYRMAQIKGFQSGEPYQLEDKTGIFFYDRYPIVTNGKLERAYPWQTCSNSKYGAEELAQFLVSLSEAGMARPTKRQLEARVDRINEFLSKSRSNDDINHRVKLRKKYQHLAALKRAANPPPPPGFSEHAALESRIEATNRANRLANQNDVNRALIEAKRQKKRAFAEAQRKREAERANGGGGAALDDLFDDPASGASRAATPKPAKRTLTPQTDNKGIPTVRKMVTEDEILQDMDLGIDIEV